MDKIQHQILPKKEDWYYLVFISSNSFFIVFAESCCKNYRLQRIFYSKLFTMKSGYWISSYSWGSRSRVSRRASRWWPDGNIQRWSVRRVIWSNSDGRVGVGRREVHRGYIRHDLAEIALSVYVVGYEPKYPQVNYTGLKTRKHFRIFVTPRCYILILRRTLITIFNLCAG